MNEIFNSIILKAFGRQELDLKVQPVGGGCISNTVKLSTKNKAYFLKWKQGSFGMFEKECLGLKFIKKSKSLKVPNTYLVGELEGKGFLLMEFLDSGITNSKYWEKLGNGLAQLHKKTNTYYGLDHDNYIGSLTQINKQSKTWSDFFIIQRLMPQVKLANSKGLLDSIALKLFDTLYLQINNLIPEEVPALLHGDLWSGNIHCGLNSEPYLIDPAVYYGHREAELAFTKLFGGFNDAFYDSYDQSFPMISGFESRIELFNLYPLLVHLNLFGQSYLPSILKTLKRHS